MRKLVPVWLALFAAATALTTGVTGAAITSAPWSSASTGDLMGHWSDASFDQIQKSGGVTAVPFGSTQTFFANLCRTGTPRGCGGHCCICTDLGYNFTPKSPGVTYAKTVTRVCGNETQYALYINGSCSGATQNNGACNAGAWTWTDGYDP